MKKYLFILATLAITLVTSILSAGEMANYTILKGKLHSGGKARVEVLEESELKYAVKMDYEIYKKILVPIPDHALKGDTIIELPPQFATEAGYLELEAKGEMEIERAVVKFIKRVKWGKYSDAYQIQILPTNGKSKIEVTYHPEVKASGWARIVITFISPLPILNGYQAQIEINK